MSCDVVMLALPRMGWSTITPKRITCPSSESAAAQKTSWLSYAKNGNSDVEQPSKRLWEIGFMTQWAAKATTSCNITNFNDWYENHGTIWPVQYLLTTILRSSSYPHQIRDSYYNPVVGWQWSRPAFYDPSDHNELYIFDLIVN